MTTRTADLVVAAPAGPRERFGWAPLLVVLTGTFMTFLDFFIVNVALPSIQGRLHAGPAAIQLVVAGFGLAFAVGMISGGRLGDLYGRRRMFTVGLALFTVTSAACGLAPTAGFLDVARVLQGGAAAMMTPQVLAILGTIYTGPRRAKAFAAYGMTMGIAGVGGVGTLTGIAFGAVPASFFFVLALYLQDGRGLSPLVSGVVFSAVGVGFFAAMLTAEPMTRRMGRQILAVGAAVVAAGCLLAASAARAGSALELAPGLVTVGFGIGMVLVPLTATALARIAAEHAGAASGVLTTGQQVGGALGVAVIGVVFFGAAGGGIAHAFAASLVVLAVLTVATAALVQLLPGPGSASQAWRPEPASPRR
jgi:MFS family permease